jgi:hypothetical protein
MTFTTLFKPRARGRHRLDPAQTVYRTTRANPSDLDALHTTAELPAFVVDTLNLAECLIDLCDWPVEHEVPGDVATPDPLGRLLEHLRWHDAEDKFNTMARLIALVERLQELVERLQVDNKRLQGLLERRP